MKTPEEPSIEHLYNIKFESLITGTSCLKEIFFFVVSLLLDKSKGNQQAPLDNLIAFVKIILYSESCYYNTVEPR